MGSDKVLKVPPRPPPFLNASPRWSLAPCIVNTLIILSSPTKKLSANRNNNYHFSNLFINSVPIHRRTIYHSSTKIFLSFYNKEENIINYQGKQKLLGSAFQLMHISISKLHTNHTTQTSAAAATQCRMRNVARLATWKTKNYYKDDRRDGSRILPQFSQYFEKAPSGTFTYTWDTCLTKPPISNNLYRKVSR